MPLVSSRTFILTGTLLLLCAYTFAQPGFKWAKKVPGPSFDRSHGLAIDKSGKIYAAGSFENTVDFNSDATPANKTSEGLGDIFITQYDASGNFVWSKTMGSTGMDAAKAITVDNAGDLITVGTFENEVDLDPTTGVFKAGQPGYQNVFINKLDASGKFKWSQCISSPDVFGCNSVKTDANGNIYFTGSFKGQVDFNPGAGVNILTALDRMRDLFIVKLNTSGAFQWATSFAVNCNDIGKAFDVDAQGNVFVSGSFYNGEAVDFDPGTGKFNSTPLTSEDVFLLKLNTNGNFEWVNHLKGTFYNAKTSITVDKNSNVYIAGNFHKSVDLEAGSGSFMVNATGTTPDAFISKVSPEGNFLWAKQFNGVHEAGPVSISNNGEVVFTGMYTGTVDFDPGANSFNLNTAGKFDIFLSRLDQEGNFICAGSLGGAETDRVSALLIDNNNNILITGAFVSTADVDPGAGTFNISPSSEEVFICKLGECGVTTKINEIEKELNISIFPNPTHGVLNVAVNLAESEYTKVKIYNALGSLVAETTIIADLTILDLSKHAKGIYFLSFYNETGKALLVKRIIVQ